MIAILHISSFLQCNLWGKSVYKKLECCCSKLVILFLYAVMNGENVRISPFIPLKKKRKPKTRRATHPRKCPRICQ